MPVFPAIFERVAGNLLSVDGSATQLPAILLAILLGVDAPLENEFLKSTIDESCMLFVMGKTQPIIT